MIENMKQVLLSSPSALLVAAKAYAKRFGERVYRGTGRTWVVARGDCEVWLPPNQGAYVFTVVREFEYYFASVEPEVVGERRVVDCTRPRLHHLRGMMEPIIVTGLPEPVQTNAVYVLEPKLPEGGVVIDAGAYCGAASIMFSDAVGPSGTVVSIEPDPRNFDALERNTRTRNNIHRFQGALWDEDGDISFAAEANMGSAVGNRRPGADMVSVKSYSPAELVRSLSLARIDGIKLDIEGSEAEVIPALEPLIEEFSPRLIFELHDIGSDAVKNIFAAIDRFGYEVEQVQQSENERFHLYSAWPRESAVSS